MCERIQKLNDEFFEEIVNIRRTLHRNPELAYSERETAKLVANTLEPLGFDIRTGVARTGVVATLHGGRPGPALALRADMDALPIQEENTFEFASENDGVMHACGHDAHTASLLGTATILHRLREELPGSIRFLFQPSEEKLPGGALPMIEEGVLGEAFGPAPGAIFGQHVHPGLDAGKIGIRSGRYMASADEVHIRVEGQGGHAATPHLLDTDPTLVAAHILVALQSVVSRHCPPDVPSVLTIGRFIADGATNVIPSQALLAGSFRSLDENWRFEAHEHIRRIAEKTAEAHGARVSVDIATGYPVLRNDPESAEFVRDAAVQYVGEDNVVDLDMWYASEDFAWFLREAPGAFYRFGTRNEEERIVHGLHTPRFTIDEEALRMAPGFMAYLATEYLTERAE